MSRRAAPQNQSRDGPGLFEADAPRPLADRLRPARLGEVVGQDHLLGPEAPIGRMAATGRLASMILCLTVRSEGGYVAVATKKHKLQPDG